MIKLRKLLAKDAEGMLEWMHDPDIQRNFRGSLENTTLDDAKVFIEKAETEPVDGRSIHYAIADEKDEYLGTISLKKVDMLSKNAEYAISLRKKAQGKGIATMATKELLALAFCDFCFEKVYLNVLSNNLKAINLYERCGFTYEGEFRRHLFLKGEYKSLKWYSMLNNEYDRCYVNQGGLNS